MENKILYAVVARGTTVLAEHSTVAGNANLISVRILEKLTPDDARVSYAQERHMFHVLTRDGISYLCMAEQSFGRRLPFAFLEDVARAFVASFGNTAANALAYELNGEFEPQLAERMARYSDPSADALNRVQGQLSEVKDIMINNIEKVLDRGERLDLLVDKTENLQAEATAFRGAARRARRHMGWQNIKMWVTIGAIIAALVLFCVLLGCGITFERC